MKQAGGGQDAYFHGLRLRFSHLTGFIIGAITVMDEQDKDTGGGGGGNRLPFLEIQKQVIRYVKAVTGPFMK